MCARVSVTLLCIQEIISPAPRSLGHGYNQAGETKVVIIIETYLDRIARGKIQDGISQSVLQ